MADSTARLVACTQTCGGGKLGTHNLDRHDISFDEIFNLKSRRSWRCPGVEAVESAREQEAAAAACNWSK